VGCCPFPPDHEGHPRFCPVMDERSGDEWDRPALNGRQCHAASVRARTDTSLNNLSNLAAKRERKVCTISENQAGLNALPHSRQHASWRGVMSPQNGHIRCEAKSPSRAFMLSNLRSDAARKACKERRLARNGCGAKDILGLHVISLQDQPWHIADRQFCARLLALHGM
jgi:hypothetical protein